MIDIIWGGAEHDGIQQDAHEFLTKIVDLLQHDACRSQDRERMARIANGTFGSRRDCDGCSYSTRSEESFTNLSIPLNKSIEECVKSVSAPVAIRPLQCDCDKSERCGCQATLTTTLKKLGGSLTVHIKRLTKSRAGGVSLGTVA